MADYMNMATTQSTSGYGGTGGWYRGNGASDEREWDRIGEDG